MATSNDEEILSIQYLLENPSLLQPPQSNNSTDKCKEDKLLEQSSINDLPSAYLGPQIWNDMLLSDDLKLEPVDLDELFDGNAVNAADSDLGMFMASENSPNSVNSSSPPGSKQPNNMTNMNEQQQQNAGMLRCNDSYSQQQQQQQRISPHYHLQYGTSPVNQQAHSPSDYLAVKQNGPAEMVQQQHYQQQQQQQQGMKSSPQQQPQAPKLAPHMQTPPQRRLSGAQQVVQHQQASPAMHQQQASPIIQQQQYPVFRSPYQQQQQQNNRSPPTSNYVFDYTIPSPSSDYRRRSSPSSPSGSVGYSSPQSRKRSHDSNGSTDGSSVKFKVPSPDYASSNGGDHAVTSIRIPSPVKVNFHVNESDVMISTPRKVSDEGEEETFFDPSTRSFSQEELKPQPIIRKSRKTFVPPDNKDVKYWNRRKKNNVAAKRSREARRIKENQIALRASYLEQENVSLKAEIGDLRRELGRAVDLLRTYESAYPNFQNSSFVLNPSTQQQQQPPHQSPPSGNNKTPRYEPLTPTQQTSPRD